MVDKDVNAHFERLVREMATATGVDAGSVAKILEHLSLPDSLEQRARNDARAAKHGLKNRDSLRAVKIENLRIATSEIIQ